MRSAAAVTPNTLELTGLVAAEAGRRGVQAVCRAHPSSQRACEVVAKVWNSGAARGREWSTTLDRRVQQWRMDHPALNLMLSASEGLMALQIDSTRWMIDQVGQAVKGARFPIEHLLVDGCGWTEREAHSFVDNAAATALVFLPSLLPRRLPSLTHLDYREELWKHPEAFQKAFLFKGSLSEDLILVRYGEPQGRYIWWTPHWEANALATDAAVRERLALLGEFGRRTHVTVARIPAREPFEALIGRAASLQSKLTGETVAGGGVQFKFATFKPNWIRDTRALPAAPSTSAASSFAAAEHNCVTSLQRALPPAKAPEGVPIHLGMIRPSTETVPVSVQGRGAFLKGHLPVVRVEDGGAVLIQRTTRSSLFPKQAHGMGRFGNEVYVSKGMTVAEQAEGMVRAAMHHAEQQGWKNLYVVWDPARHPIASTFERLGYTIDAIGDITAANSKKKWIRLAFDKNPLGMTKKGLVGGLVTAGILGVGSSGEAKAAMRVEDRQPRNIGRYHLFQHGMHQSQPGSAGGATGGKGGFQLRDDHHRVAVHDMFDERLAQLQGFQLPTALSSKAHQQLASVAELLQMTSNCFQQVLSYPQLHEYLPRGLVPAAHLFTGLSACLDGNPMAGCAAITTAVGLFTKDPDLMKAANVVTAGAAVIQASQALFRPMTSMLIGLPSVVGVFLAGLNFVATLANLNAMDDLKEELEAWLAQLQAAIGNIAQEVSEQLQHSHRDQIAIAHLCMEEQKALRTIVMQLKDQFAYLKDSLRAGHQRLRADGILSQAAAHETSTVIHQQQISARLSLRVSFSVLDSGLRQLADQLSDLRHRDLKRTLDAIRHHEDRYGAASMPQTDLLAHGAIVRATLVRPTGTSLHLLMLAVSAAIWLCEEADRHEFLTHSAPRIQELGRAAARTLDRLDASSETGEIQAQLSMLRAHLQQLSLT